VESLLQILFEIEAIESDLKLGQEGQSEEAEARLAHLKLLLDQLPKPIRDQYQWLRTWTPYPIARLRNRACTGCAGTYPESHAFVAAHVPQVTHCEHCLRILVLRDLALVA
jgi:predicted  nucleic acid-binding Zn-ribbon protein